VQGLTSHLSCRRHYGRLVGMTSCGRLLRSRCDSSGIFRLFLRGSGAAWRPRDDQTVEAAEIVAKPAGGCSAQDPELLLPGRQRLQPPAGCPLACANHGLLPALRQLRSWWPGTPPFLMNGVRNGLGRHHRAWCATGPRLRSISAARPMWFSERLAERASAMRSRAGAPNFPPPFSTTWARGLARGSTFGLARAVCNG